MSDSPMGDDLAAAVGARKELGDSYEAALVQSFVEKVDREIAARIERGIEARAAEMGLRRRARPRGGSSGFALASIALGIPVTAIVASQMHGLYGFLGVVVSWAGIALVNLAHVWGRRRS